MKNSLSPVLVFALTLAACGGPLTYKVASSPKAPGADATVVANVKKDQGLTELQISTANLPPPGRIVDGGKAYILWERKDSSGTWVRLGGLQYVEDTRTGLWNGSVPETGFDLTISAEKKLEVASPSGDTVFEQHIN